MPFRVLTVPFDPDAGCFHDEDLNRFCLNKRVKTSKSAFFQHEGEPYWTVFVEYELPTADEAQSGDSIQLTARQELLLKRIKGAILDMACRIENRLATVRKRDFLVAIRRS